MARTPGAGAAAEAVTTAAKKVAKATAAPKANALTPEDQLQMKVLAAENQVAWQIVQSDPELKQLFKDKIKYGWDEKLFAQKLINSQWYQENNEYARTYLTMRAQGGADFQAYEENARLAVEQFANSVGAELTDAELNDLATQYKMGGWDKPDRQALLGRALSKYVNADQSGLFGGTAGNLQRALMQTAEDNGLRLPGQFYENAARSVIEGRSTPDDWERQVREQAASRWPTFSDKILAGMNVRDLAAGYIGSMSDILEKPAELISLDDPYLRQALTKVDANGNTVQMGLGEFEDYLRHQPEYKNTQRFTDDVSSIGTNILQRMGLTG